MASSPLSSLEKNRLRGLGQGLKPHVHVGRRGLGATVLAEIETALEKNGLVKVRFDADRETVVRYRGEIAAKLGCEDVGGVGRTALFFREPAG
jgi:RNA-binding protein